MKKNWLYSILMAIPLMSGLTACNNEDDPNPNPNPNPEPTTTYGAYIVNTGNWGANDGSIQWFDMEKQTVSGDLYQAQNGKRNRRCARFVCVWFENVCHWKYVF